MGVIGFDFGDKFLPPEPIAVPEPDQDRNDELAEAKRTVSIFKTMSTQRKMRLLSEAALAEVLPWHLEEGAAYTPQNKPPTSKERRIISCRLYFLHRNGTPTIAPTIKGADRMELMD